MSEGQPKPYKLDDGAGVKEQVRAMKDGATQAGKLDRFIAIMEKVGHILRTDPNGWGDPEYASKTVDGIIRHGIIRPLAFRYAVYDQVRGVVILSVRLFAEFD